MGTDQSALPPAHRRQGGGANIRSSSRKYLWLEVRSSPHPFPRGTSSNPQAERRPQALISTTHIAPELGFINLTVCRHLHLQPDGASNTTCPNQLFCHLPPNASDLHLGSSSPLHELPSSQDSGRGGPLRWSAHIPAPLRSQAASGLAPTLPRPTCALAVSSTWRDLPLGAPCPFQASAQMPPPQTALP